MVELKKRTEAIGSLDRVSVNWDTEGGAYSLPDKSEIHLPYISEQDLDEKAIELIRGYCDHEIRHIRHSTHMTKDRIDAELANGTLKQMTNCLEDTRIEVQKGRVGEAFNIKKLRTKTRNEIVDREYKNKWSHAVTAFMYRTHGIDFPLPDEAEACFEELKPLFKEVLEARSINEVHDIALKLLDRVSEGMDELPEDMDDFSSSDDSSESDGTSSPEPADESDDENETGDSDSEENDSGSDGSSAPDEEDDEEEDEGKDGKGSGEGSEKDDEEESEGTPGSSDSDLEGDETPEDSTDDKDPQEEMEGMEEDLERNDLASDLESKINDMAKDISKDYWKYESYTEADGYFTYKVKPGARDSKLEEHSSKIAKSLGNNLAKILRSKTDTYRKFGETRGRKMARNRMAQFAEGTNDRPFYQEQNVEQLHSRVSILIDMSSSMHSEIRNAVSFAYTLGLALSRINVEFEILGFYNVDFSYSTKWCRKHDHAARNCESPFPKIYEIFHGYGDKFNSKKFLNIANQIIEKWSCGENYHPDFDDLDMAGHTYENDDGEAVWTAAMRLLENSDKEEKKVLFVLSDGTVAAANRDPKTMRCTYVPSADKHLEKVINTIREKTDVEIFGFGFSGARGIERYYGKENSIFVSSLNDELKKKFLAELKKKLLGSIK